MRRFAMCMFSAMLSVALASPAHANSNSAPADEYFGHYHMSILGIRNAIHDMTQRAQQNPADAASLLASAQLTDDSVHDWQDHYPGDAWIPKTILSLERLYVAIGTSQSAEDAVRTADWLDTSFPHSLYARMARTELAALSGNTEDAQPADESPAMLGMVPALAPTEISPAVEDAASLPRDTSATVSDVSPAQGSPFDAPQEINTP